MREENRMNHQIQLIDISKTDLYQSRNIFHYVSITSTGELQHPVIKHLESCLMEINTIFSKLSLAAAAWIGLEIVTQSQSERDRRRGVPYV